MFRATGINFSSRRLLVISEMGEVQSLEALQKPITFLAQIQIETITFLRLLYQRLPLTLLTPSNVFLLSSLTFQLL
jgi:hypothetical protein